VIQIEDTMSEKKIPITVVVGFLGAGTGVGDRLVFSDHATVATIP
jgi:hypothetical protein